MNHAVVFNLGHFTKLLYITLHSRPRRVGLETVLRPSRDGLEAYTNVLSRSRKIGLGVGLGLETRRGNLVYFVFCIFVIPINTIISQSHMIDPRQHGSIYTKQYNAKT